ncbi:MAG: hemagglutinin repeat-containing protein [Alphaproteobacteria bacterium]|nr:hemagglutinin repeat-containing protein [Alphaproteobacteria bacterium]
MLRKDSFIFLLSGSVSTFALSQAIAEEIIIESNSSAFLTQSTSGVDVLNIAAPTAAGVSHNKFIDFNVNEKGLIINNLSASTAIQSESNLGGAVTFNPNFGDGAPARIILNEVTGTNLSLLKGYTEIFGDKAAYILANPNGISCEGCGFLNTSRLTLVAGRPEIENEEIKSFNLSAAGSISVGGESFGMHINASPAELVANVIQIAANIYADQEVSLLTGNKFFDYRTGEILSDDAPHTGIAIDSSALGGMYAGAIKIYASQNGMGIHAAENLVADTGRLEITANGDISFKTVAALNSDIAVSSRSGSIAAGIIQAQKEITLKAAQEISVQNLLGENIDLTAHAVSAISDGKISALQTFRITAVEHAALEGEYILTNAFIGQSGSFTLNTQLYAGSFSELSAIGNIDISGGFIQSDLIDIIGKDFIAYGDLVGESINLTAEKILLNGRFTGGTAILNSARGFVNSSKEFYANQLTINALSLYNEKKLGAGDITLNLQNDLFNVDKIHATGSMTLSAANIHNYGQIAANSNIGITAQNYVNYRDSGLLSGEDIEISVQNNLINYLSEIYAVGNIILTGKAKTISAVDYTTVYDNPYIENQHSSSAVVNNVQIVEMQDSQTEGSLDIYLPDENKTITLPAGAFEDEAPLGSSYALDGYTIYLGQRIVTPREVSETVDVEYQVEVPYEAVIEGEFNEDGTPKTETKIRIETHIRQETHFHTVYDVTFENPEALTVLDSNGNEVPAIPFEGSDGEANTQTAANGQTALSNTLDAHIRPISYSAPENQANAVINLGGRIESERDINIFSDKLYNVALNLNTGESAYQLGYDRKAWEVPYHVGWQELGRYYVQSVNLTGEAGQILSGRNLDITSREILNQSSVLSAKNNLMISTRNLRNTSYYETTVPLAVHYQMRTKKRKHGKVHHYIHHNTGTYTDIVYSKARSLITGGSNVIINAQNGTVQNDQTVAATGFYTSGGTNRPDVITNTITVNLTLPKGPNGLFVRSENPKYLVTASVDILNNGYYIGADYFLQKVGENGLGFNNRKALGDAAYETRLVMDAIRNITGNHYLSSAAASDAEQMQALLDAAIKEQTALDLKIGVSLTQEQIAQLSNDIIWYVEQEIDGQKVLVPQIYLSMATLQRIADGETGDLITGGNVQIAADRLTNAGKLSAADLLGLTANGLHNKGGLITADKTAIKGGNVLNETLKNHEERRIGGTYFLTETLGKTAEIKGKTGVQIDIDGDLVMKAAAIHSDAGLSINANNIILDTVELHNRYENAVSKKKSTGKEIQTTVTDSLKNFGSAVVAGGTAVINTVKNFFAKGAVINAGSDFQLIAGSDITLQAAEDTELQSTVTQKSNMMKSSRSAAEDEISRLTGSLLTARQDLTLISGKDTNIIASALNAAGNANILTGFTVLPNGTTAASGQGSFNLLNGYETTRHYEHHEKSSHVNAIKNIAAETAKLAATNGASAYKDFADNRGKIGAEATIGERGKDKRESFALSSVSSHIQTGGDLNISSTENILVRGSDIFGGKDINLSAQKDLNILSSSNTVSEKHTHEQTKTKFGAYLGHIASDAVYDTIDAVYAAEEVRKASKELDHIQRLHAEGKASKQAVSDAALNLAAAIEQFADAYGMGAISADSAITSMDNIVNSMKAGTTAPTLGFYAEMGLTYDTKETKTNFDQVINTESTISADKDIKLYAGQDIKQTGSTLISVGGNIEYAAGNDLILESSVDSYALNSKTKNKSVSAGATNKGGVYGSFSASNSSYRAQGEHHNNSAAIANNGSIAINAGNDITASGYNALAQKIGIQAGGNMTLTSQQDNAYANSRSFGFGMGHKQNDDSHKTLLNIFNTNSKTDWQQVTLQTSVIGTQSVDVNIAGTLEMNGSLIANTDMTGNDGGNLNITAGSLKTTDLHNFNNSSGNGFGFGTSFGPAADKENQKYTAGSTTLALTHQGQENKSITYAVIGQGTLNIADGGPTDIHRDINNTEIITQNKMTGALNASASFDNRVITGDFSKWAANVFKNNADHYDQRNQEQKKYFEKVSQNVEDLSLLPTFGLKQSHVGRETFDVKNSTGLSDSFGKRYHERKPEQLFIWEKLLSPFDTNPIFNLFDAVVPGLHAAANVHDTQLDQTDNASVLRDSITPSFIGTYFSIIYGKMPSLFIQNMENKK